MIGTIVVNNDGIPIKSTLDNHTTTQYAGLINQLVDQVYKKHYFLTFPAISESQQFFPTLILTVVKVRLSRNVSINQMSLPKYEQTNSVFCLTVLNMYWYFGIVLFKKTDTARSTL